MPGGVGGPPPQVQADVGERDEQQHRDQQQEGPAEVDPGPSADGEPAVEDVHAHMAVVAQGPGGGQHEDHGMHVHHRLLHHAAVDAEDVAQDHDGELHRHHDDDQPGDAAPDQVGEGVESGEQGRFACRGIHGRLVMKENRRRIIADSVPTVIPVPSTRTQRGTCFSCWVMA